MRTKYEYPVVPGLTIKLQSSVIKCNQSDSEGNYKLISTTNLRRFWYCELLRISRNGNITVNLKKIFDICQLSRRGRTGDCIKKKTKKFIEKIKMHCLVGTWKFCKFSISFFGWQGWEGELTQPKVNFLQDKLRYMVHNPLNWKSTPCISSYLNNGSFAYSKEKGVGVGRRTLTYTFLKRLSRYKYLRYTWLAHFQNCCWTSANIRLAEPCLLGRRKM